MSLKFGTEGLLASARENFIGEITSAVYPCKCDVCRKGDKALIAQGQEPSGDRLHMKMEPLTVYEKIQQEWLTPTKTLKSKWGAFNQRLEQIGCKVKSEADLIGKVFEFESATIKAGVTDTEVTVWLPVREVTGEELEKLRSAKKSAGDPEVVV